MRATLVPHTGIAASLRWSPAEYGCYGGFRPAPVGSGRVEGYERGYKTGANEEEFPLGIPARAAPSSRPMANTASTQRRDVDPLPEVAVPARHQAGSRQLLNHGPPHFGPRCLLVAGVPRTSVHDERGALVASRTEEPRLSSRYARRKAARRRAGRSDVVRHPDA